MVITDFNSTPINQESPSPQGFLTFVTNAGTKDASLNVAVVKCDIACTVAGVYTQNHFSGPAVLASRQQLEKGYARALVVISKNANVATGYKGKNDLDLILQALSRELDIRSDEIQTAATGVIGKPLPVENIINELGGIVEQFTTPGDFCAISRAIMTTDTRPKAVSMRIGACTLVGIAKGVGMIEPNMATLLVYFFTDAAIEQSVLQTLLESVVNKTFNCISIDTDTSTSDSCAIFASGLAGSVNSEDFGKALYDVASHLALMILSDGEGVTKVIKVLVTRAQSDQVAKVIAKSIINSPLVKTAIYGGDPNWGRITMAIGKCDVQYIIDPARIRIVIGDFEVYPEYDVSINNSLKSYMETNEQITINIDMGIGHGQAQVWGCDLSHGYVDINSSYTT
jgi:glutamate N-acetyltransferase / amino-acid N-acetyltransferase